MEFYFVHVLQIVAALGLINVWLLRFSKATPYRGRAAQNMVEEFAVYGLPRWSVYVVGALKLFAAFLLIVGLLDGSIAQAGAMLLTLLMLGAVGMHLKVKDSLRKTFPSLAMLGLGVAIVLAWA